MENKNIGYQQKQWWKQPQINIQNYTRQFGLIKEKTQVGANKNKIPQINLLELTAKSFKHKTEFSFILIWKI